eukprot:SAG31_NODE_17911_length_653_cov_1.904332_1_plen_65_part_00
MEVINHGGHKFRSPHWGNFRMEAAVAKFSQILHVVVAVHTGCTKSSAYYSEYYYPAIGTTYAGR